MSASRHHDTILSFRNEWVLGRLEYLRAVDALDAAEVAARRVLEAIQRECEPECDAPPHERAAADVERARARLDEIRTRLVHQFDTFCGVGTLRATRSR